MSNEEKIKELEKKIRESYNSGVKRRDIYPLLKKDFDELYSTKQDYCDKLIAKVVYGMEKDLVVIKEKRTQNKKQDVLKELAPENLRKKVVRELMLGYNENDVFDKLQDELLKEFSDSHFHAYNYVKAEKDKLNKILTPEEKEALKAKKIIVKNLKTYRELEKICEKVKKRFVNAKGVNNKEKLRNAIAATATMEAINADKVKRAVKTVDIEFYQNCMRAYTEEELLEFAHRIVDSDMLSAIATHYPQYKPMEKLLLQKDPELLNQIKATFKSHKSGIKF